MAFNAGDIEATLTLDRSPFQRGLREARTEAERFEKKRIKANVDVDVDKRSMDKLRADMARLSGTRKGVKISVDVDKNDVEQIKSLLDEIGDNTEATARRSGNRLARALLNPIVLQMGLLPGIAAASAGAAGIAIGGLALGFGAIAIAAVKSNQDLRATWGDTWDYIKRSSAEDAGILVGRFQEIGNDVLVGFRELRPEMREIFRDIDPLLQDFADGIIGMAEEAVPRFEDALALSGPTMRGFEGMLRSIGVGVGQMAVNISDSAIESGQGLDLLGVLLRNLLSDLGRFISMFSVAWARVGPDFVNTLDQIIDSILEFTQGGLTGFSQGLGTTLTLVNALMSVLGPFLSTFGQLAGYGLAAAAAWKLVSGTFGLLAKAIQFLNPVAVAARLSGVATAMTGFGASAGKAVTNVTGSAKAGERLAATTSKVGNALVRAGSFLPLFGLAVAAIAAQEERAAQQTQEFADALLKGGEAGRAAAQTLDVVREAADRLQSSESGMADALRSAADAAEASYRKQRDGLTEVELAQIRAKNAQSEYDAAVRTFGANSIQAQYAQEALAIATDGVEDAQNRAAAATQTHTDRMVEQMNLALGAAGAQLNYQSALLQLEGAEKSVTEAIKAHGRGSLEARQADTQYQQTLLQVIQSVGARVQAEAEARGDTDATEQAAAAMRFELVRLAVQAGRNLPPALATMMDRLSDSELAAYGVQRQVDKTGTSIYRLPPGKRLRFPSDAPAAKQGVDALDRSVRNVPGTHYIDFVLRTIGSPPPQAATGFGPGLGMLGTVPRRARGGPVEANKPYWVGDTGGGVPELFFPDVDGFVLNGRDSAKLAAGVGITQGVKHAPLSGGDGAAALDYDRLADMVGAAVARYLDGVRLRVSGPEWAKLVNEQNLHDARR